MHTRAAWILLAWMLIALAFGAADGLRLAPPPFPQLVLVGLLGLLSAAYAGMRSFRSWLHSLSLDALVAVHLSRFVGFYFLHLHGRGELPYEFAVLGGWGDILVAFAAGALLGARRLGNPPPRIAYLLWNLLGALDLLFVVTTAGRLAFAEPGSMDAILRLPLSLLPTFLVPLLLFTHGVLFLRLLRPTRSTPARR